MFREVLQEPLIQEREPKIHPFLMPPKKDSKKTGPARPSVGKKILKRSEKSSAFREDFGEVGSSSEAAAPTEDFPLFDSGVVQNLGGGGGQEIEDEFLMMDIGRSRRASLERGRSSERGSESQSSSQTIRPGDEVDGGEKEAAPKHFQIPEVVVHPTHVFGRGHDDGTQEHPPSILIEKSGESPFERENRLRRYERWNAFCRFLNESRWMSRCEQGDRREVIRPSEQPDEATPEDFVYQAYLRHENESVLRKNMLAKIKKEDQALLQERCILFNRNSRLDWAKMVLEGRIGYRPVVHVGFFGVEYLIMEENGERHCKLVDLEIDESHTTARSVEARS
jgi:hypothetical protein